MSTAGAVDRALAKRARLTVTDRPGWTLVWADEFNVDGRPDPEKWGYESGRVRNRELQVYTVDRRENAAWRTAA